MTKNEILFKAAEDAVNALFNDKSVKQNVTIDRLEYIRSNIDVMIESIDVDEDEDEGDI